jgi:hypothetical protein
MASKKPAPSKQIVHERNATLRTHRVVIINAGRPDASPWIDENCLGLYKGLYFNQREGVLPVGVFRMTHMAYELLA